MVSSLPIFEFVVAVDHDEDEVKSAEKTCCESSVDIDVILGIPLLAFQHWIRGCNDGCSSVDLTHDACLCNGNSLLLHGLVDAPLVFLLDD